MGTAPLYVVAPRPEKEPARFAFFVPLLDVAVNIPVHLRTRERLRAADDRRRNTQSVPLASALFRVWGLPASSDHDFERFLPGSPGAPAGCPEQGNAQCASKNGQIPRPSGIQVKPLIENPSICTGKRCV